MTILAFDTATSYGAVCAVSTGGRARRAKAGDLMAAVDELVGDPAEIERIVVGRGPGASRASASAWRWRRRSPTRSTSRCRAPRRSTPSPQACPCSMRAQRGVPPGPRVCRPEELDVAGQTLVGDGAVRYRVLFEERAARGSRPTTIPRTCPTRCVSSSAPPAR
jgi:Inactive homolog of metal-dependent proteases, putative molecular chaperone